MSRRSVTEDVEYPLLDQMESEEPAARERSKRSRPAKRDREEAEHPKRRRINLFYWTLPFFALVAAFALTMAFHRVEAFLINDSRFHLKNAADYGKDPAEVKIAGIQRASKAEILRVLEQDFGRSLYLFPLAERRRNLLAVDWVKEATVSRRWPNQIHITLTEREPVAFAQINVPDSVPRFHLIDADGVLLPLPKGEKFDTFVVLTGLNAKDAEAGRRIRVQQVLAMLGDIGPLAAHVSEVDVRDPANLQTAMQVEKRVVTVKLGSRNFRQRMQNFLSNFAEIRKARPNSTVFDLRIDDRITAVEGVTGGQP
ncbi:MAG TPA: FtsQ-type POTRA domain-containing protein [Bryobacteraceae bacterium]|nr:FtsQ-type POTRA domain-containing protein [Bryobacteraceae bacterium]